LAAAAIGLIFARTAIFATQSAERMKGITIGMHLFNDEVRTFPRRASFDAAGQPLLSWRVHLLPQLGQQTLYEQFHLDEPWDSEHNRTLIPKIPSIYRPPGMWLETGTTCYVVPVADHLLLLDDASSEAYEEELFKSLGPTAFPLNLAQRQEFDQDHLSSRAGTRMEAVESWDRTIVLLQVSPERAVIWTAPNDLDVTMPPETGVLHSAGNGKFLAVTADGTVQRMPLNLNREEMQRLFAAQKFGYFPPQPRPR
jgi:hypothetical protein